MFRLLHFGVSSERRASTLKYTQSKMRQLLAQNTTVSIHFDCEEANAERLKIRVDKNQSLLS